MHIKEFRNLIFGAILGVFLGISILIFNYHIAAVALDTNYSAQYEKIIKPEGAKHINSILFEVDKLNDTQDKLNAIARWESNNFTSYFWGAPYPDRDKEGVYWTYKNGKVRAYEGTLGYLGVPIFGHSSPYRDDPYWITYYKAGECEEKAALFAEVTSRAGFVTRQVIIPNVHSWVEIKINDEWKYFDIDCYYRFDRDMNKSTIWYNETKYFRVNCGTFSSNEVYTKTGEDITRNYDPPRDPDII